MGVELDRAEEVVELGANVRQNLGVGCEGKRAGLGLGLRGLRRKKGRLLPCYSIAVLQYRAGTVHEMAARVGGGVGGAGSEDRDTR